MTPKQKQDYNNMLNVLNRIKKYQTPGQLRKRSERDYGLSYLEALEMSYENIQHEAKTAIKGVRLAK